MTGSAIVDRYVQRRSGLGDVHSKLRSVPCKIAYFGASMVVQREGYRPRLHAKLSEATGQAHQMVTAGISGSGSISGAFMIGDLVLRHAPELCFVDFMARDAAAPAAPAWVGPAVEGIVLKLLEHGCRPCFLYMYRRDEARGVHAEVKAAWEAVADHYGVPSIDMASHIRDSMTSGTIELDALIYDIAHTTPDGADFLAEAIAPAVLSMPDSPAPIEVPRKRLHDAPLSDARVVPARDVPVRDPRRCEWLRFRFFYDYLAIPEGNAFQWDLDAELVGLHLVLGPDTSAIRLTAGNDVRDLVLRDEECFYDRVATFIFEVPYPAGTALTIEPIESPDARPDEGVAVRLKVVGFLVR
jgi:hypothetical protein